MGIVTIKLPTSMYTMLEKRVYEILKEFYSEDSCPPTVIVSNVIDQEVEVFAITLTHAGRSFTKLVSAHTNLEDCIVSLYNHTM